MATKDDITLSKGSGEEKSPASAQFTPTQRDVPQVSTLSEVPNAETREAIEEARAQRDGNGRFTPGHERLGGREPGTKNKLDHHTKVMLKALVDHGLEDAQDVYDRIKAKQPRAALTILSRFAEYAAPKLARTEVVGEDGGPVIIEKRIHDSSDKDKE